MESRSSALRWISCRCRGRERRRPNGIKIGVQLKIGAKLCSSSALIIYSAEHESAGNLIICEAIIISQSFIHNRTLVARASLADARILMSFAPHSLPSNALDRSTCTFAPIFIFAHRCRRPSLPFRPYKCIIMIVTSRAQSAAGRP